MCFKLQYSEILKDVIGNNAYKILINSFRMKGFDSISDYKLIQIVLFILFYLVLFRSINNRFLNGYRRDRFEVNNRVTDSIAYWKIIIG